MDGKQPMSPETAASLFSTILIGGLVVTIVALSVRRTRRRFVLLAPSLATLVAIGATAGSLYFSERAGFEPCELCWYQRIAMYPMALVLPFGVARDDRGVLKYAVLLSSAGFLIAAHHVRIQWFPEQSNSCAIDNPCSAKWVEGFGVFTIPQMAAMSFLLIGTLAVASMRARR